MTLEEFIDKVMDEEIVIPLGDLEDDAFVTVAADPSELTDEDLAAEAINQGVEDIKDMKWSDIVAKVAATRKSEEQEDE